MVSPTKIRLNVVDQVISYLWPATGLRRLAARSVLSQHQATKPSRMRKGR